MKFCNSDLLRCLASNMVFVQQALSGNMIIPDWKRFAGLISNIFEECRPENAGEVESGPFLLFHAKYPFEIMSDCWLLTIVLLRQMSN